MIISKKSFNFKKALVSGACLRNSRIPSNDFWNYSHGSISDIKEGK